MHDYHLIKALLDGIIKKVGSHETLERVVSLTIRLGKMKMVSPENFRQVFEDLSRDTICEGAQLDITETDADELVVEEIKGEFKEEHNA